MSILSACFCTFLPLNKCFLSFGGEKLNEKKFTRSDVQHQYTKILVANLHLVCDWKKYILSETGLNSNSLIYHCPIRVNRGYSNICREYDFYFISWSEKIYISFVPSALMKYTFFHFTRWNKSHIHDKHLNFLFIIYITFDRRDANLAF